MPIEPQAHVLQSLLDAEDCLQWNELVFAFFRDLNPEFFRDLNPELRMSFVS
jgi:uncharacterized protein YerC